jgi:ATP-binding cassette subfamily B protein
LRLKFNSNISQDGKSISGGQAQRLSIARALYKESEIYIFDESTNALDRTTEEKILRNFNLYFASR